MNINASMKVTTSKAAMHVLIDPCRDYITAQKNSGRDSMKVLFATGDRLSKNSGFGDRVVDGKTPVL
jgi:hypothetical protein